MPCALQLECRTSSFCMVAAGQPAPRGRRCGDRRRGGRASVRVGTRHAVSAHASARSLRGSAASRLRTHGSGWRQVGAANVRAESKASSRWLCWCWLAASTGTTLPLENIYSPRYCGYFSIAEIPGENSETPGNTRAIPAISSNRRLGKSSRPSGERLYRVIAICGICVAPSSTSTSTKVRPPCPTARRRPPHHAMSGEKRVARTLGARARVSAERSRRAERLRVPRSRCVGSGEGWLRLRAGHPRRTGHGILSCAVPRRLARA